ncbi:CoA pyrophosphatase [bacterium]|nr:CoA pyrophosphatase [bacterium]
MIREEDLKTLLETHARRELDLCEFKPASVLIPILAHGGAPRVVVTVRTGEVEHHKHQISFPGGRRDEGETDEEAALREAHEEIGLAPSAVRIVGRLDDIYTISDYRVIPFVGWIDEPVTLVPNERETANILEIPIVDLLDPSICRTEDSEFNGVPITMYFFYWRSHVIWGATGLIMGQFLDFCRKVFA